METALLHLLLLHFLLLLLNSRDALCQTDCATQPTCDTTDTARYGYGDLSIKCPNGTKISSGPCYLADYCDSVAADQSNDMLKIKANNINPQQCHAYSSEMRRSLYTAYNNWCCQGDNYLKCCPGSTGWPTGVSKTADNCMAMRNESEVLYFGASGSSTQTQFLIRMAPRGDSTLCRLLLYSTSSGANSTSAAAAAAEATTSPATSTTATTTKATTTTNATTATTSVKTAAATSFGSTANPHARRRRYAVEAGVVEPLDVDGGAAQQNRPIGLGLDRSRSRRSSAVVTITLNSATVEQLIGGIGVSTLVVSAVSTASNGTLTVTVTVDRNVAPASSLSPDKRSDSWVVATGVICGLIGLLLICYLIACQVHRSKKSDGDNLPL